MNAVDIDPISEVEVSIDGHRFGFDDHVDFMEFLDKFNSVKKRSWLDRLLRRPEHGAFVDKGAGFSFSVRDTFSVYDYLMAKVPLSQRGLLMKGSLQMLEKRIVSAKINLEKRRFSL